MELLASGQIVYDPRGAVTPEPTDLAKRLPRLENARLGVLDNAKWNASKLLSAISKLLQERQRIESVTFYKKESFSRVAQQTLVDEIINSNDVALSAIGD